MRMKLPFLCVILYFLLLLDMTGFSRDSTLIRFQLKDQFNQLWTQNDFLGTTTIIVGSDRHGSEYNESWSFAIYDSLQRDGLADSVKFLAVADTRGVPFFFRKMVRSHFPKEAHRWILLDWHGDFAQSYQFVPAECNLVLIDKKGKLVYHLSGKDLNNSKLKIFIQQIRLLFH